MKHLLPTCLTILFICSYLFAQTIPQENVQGRIDAKRLHPRQQMTEHSIGHLPQGERKSLYQRPSPMDSLMQLPTAQSKKLKSNSINKITLPQSEMYVADTLIVMSFYYVPSRCIYDYSPSGKMTVESYQNLSNLSNQWVNSSRSTYTYDASGNRLTYLSEGWSNNQWVNSSRYTYTYDASGNRLTSLYEVSQYSQWGGMTWVNHSRYTYTYDANGNQLTSLFELWSNNQWVNSSRSTYTYDANGNQLTGLGEWWTNNQWVNSSRSTYTYDASGNRLTYLSEWWSNNQWVNSSRYTYTYDANGNQLTYLYEWWQNNQLVYSWRYTYTYDANGNQLTGLGEWWTNNQWVNEYRYTYTYDANGNQLTGLGEWWTNNQWVIRYRYTYKYVYGNLLSEGLAERWDGDSWEPYEQDGIGGNPIFREGYKILFSYKLIIITNVNKNEGIIVKEYSLSQNYPNPFNPSTSIRYSLPASAHVKLTIHDILGREIATLVNEEQSAGFKEVDWNAREVSSGIYFYKLQAGSFVETKKCLVVK